MGKANLDTEGELTHQIGDGSYFYALPPPMGSLWIYYGLGTGHWPSQAMLQQFKFVLVLSVTVVNFYTSGNHVNLGIPYF